MINEKETSLGEALKDAFIYELPREWDNESVWIRAIGLITKTNARQSYCLLRRGDNGEPQIYKTYGDACKIAKLDNIYPYIFLNKKYVCDFKSKQEIVDYLLNYNEDFTSEELQAKKKDDLYNICVNLWAKRQIEYTNKK